MDYESFITTVEGTAHVSAEEARAAACATLDVLSKRITAGEAEDIAFRLPPELRECIDPAGPPERFHVDEFLRRVAERVGAGEDAAERDARGVFSALWSAVGPDEFADMRAQLPNDFGPLLDEAIAVAPSYAETTAPRATDIGYDELLLRVMERSGLDRERARRAVHAVLDALAIRITAGQAEDLEQLLPIELRPALERGRARARGRAVPMPMPLEAFLEAVAKLEDASKAEAAEHARAVLQVVREAVGEQEWQDTTAQLPDEYRTLWRQGQGSD
jgi:uncharacterized protein (DUF2267 family)